MFLCFVITTKKMVGALKKLVSDGILMNGIRLMQGTPVDEFF